MASPLCVLCRKGNKDCSDFNVGLALCKSKVLSPRRWSGLKWEGWGREESAIITCINITMIALGGKLMPGQHYLRL